MVELQPYFKVGTKNMSHPYRKPDEVIIKRRFEEYKVEYINRYFPKDSSIKILDLGSSYGLFLAACQKLGYKNLTGIEEATDIASFSKERFNLGDVRTGDISDLMEEMSDDTYGVIAAFNIIEHIKKDQVQRALSLVFKKLKPSGYFMLEVPNADSPLGIHTLYSDITHQQAFTSDLLKELLEQAGFSQISVYPKFINKNPLVRLGQKILAKIVGLDSKLMFSGNIVAVARKMKER